MKCPKAGRLLQVLSFSLVLLALALNVWPREITDMAGRRVIVPDIIRRAYSSSPPVTYLITAIDPTLLVGLNFPIAEGGKEYLPKCMHSLPVLGGFFGKGRTANIEMIMKAKPDVIVMGGPKTSSMTEKYESTLKNLGIPFVYVYFDTVADYTEAFRFLGQLFNKEERTARLGKYGKDVLAEIGQTVEAIPADRRPRVYYAEDKDGLATDCDRSYHAELINLVGARNVHRCTPKDTMGMERISFEQVVLYNPEVILVKEEEFFRKIFRDPGWRRIKAVREKRVYLIPGIPFNWFDRPPSFMRFLGVQWLMNCLYPQHYGKDMIKETGAFYRLFLGVAPTEKQIHRIIYG
ncbi:MAG: High-affinity heme uptake system protein IsdE precursor [Syntrophorhabdaceae bacterium PtaU1.Bin034]|jgi:iron complex transport system substrate-binding protein|nr:MAG: High-affinity heme uptake system protein IsdE precursor [Syntrophorhabdaceae bacterium PtaU1.Bin034]